MLYMKCEYCLCNGVISQHCPDDLDLVEEIICPVCDGTGYHRKVVESSIDSMRRWSVLRMLDLTFLEHKHRDRTQRLMDLFYIVPFADEPEMTEAANELRNEEAEDD